MANDTRPRERMNLSVAFRSPDGAERVQPGVQWAVKRLAWQALGGPRLALIEPQAPPNAAASIEALQLIGCPVEVMQDGEPAWWGFVETVECRQQALGIRLSLAGMANRVAAAYTLPGAGMSGGGERCTTAWVEDAASMATFGVKEALLNLAMVSQELAETRRDAYLAAHAYPSAEAIEDSTGQGRDGVRLVCRGWYDTLAWKFYNSPAGVEENSAAGSPLDLGAAAGCTALAQSITPATGGWQARQAWLQARRLGSPADALRVQVCTDSDGAPGSVLTGVDIGGASLAETYAWLGFDLPAPVDVTAGERLWLVVRRSGGVDAANYYRVRVDTACGYAGGSASIYNGAAWSAPSPTFDLCFRLTGEAETTRQAAAVASAAACGQFLAGVVIDAPSGVYSNPSRDGDRRGMEELEDLLAAGDTGGRRLLCHVDPRRRLWITAAPPAALAELMLTPGGDIRRRDGSAVRLGEGVCGRWAQAAFPALLAGAMPSPEAGKVWLEGVSFDGVRLSINR